MKGVEVREIVVVDIVEITETAEAEEADVAVTKTRSLMDLLRPSGTRSDEA